MTIYIPNIELGLQLKDMLISKVMTEYPNYNLFASASLVILTFIVLGNINNFVAYGIEEKALFFGGQLDISSNGGNSKVPQIAVQGNHVYVVWQDNSSGNYDVLFTYSSDNGNSFTPVRDLSNNSGTSELPQIAVQGNHVYVVWQDNSSGNYDVFFTYSSDNGNSFTPVRDLSNNSGTSELPQIAVQGNHVYVVWQDNTAGNYDIYLTRSLSNSTLFKDRNISKNNGTSQYPQIAAQDNNVYVAWQDNTTGNYEILFRRSATNGEGFKSVNLRDTNGTSQFPQIAVQGKIVFVVWQDNTSGNDDIFLQRVSSNGTKYNYRNISDNNGTSIHPQISVSDSDTYVMWKDNDTGVGRIFFKHIQKDNETGKLEYGSTYRLNHTGSPDQGRLAAGSDHFYGVWTAHTNNDSSVLEFYPFMLLEDNSGIAIPLTRLSSNASVANPDIITQNGDTFLVWEGEANGNKDIFFKKFSTSFFERRN